MTKIHPTAIVNNGANIASDVEVGAYSIIEEGVEIGKGTQIFNHVTINKGAKIGENNKIYPHAVLAAFPQDLKFKGEYTECIIGDDNIIRECVTISRGTTEHYRTIVGNNCLFMAYSHAAHDNIIGNNCIFANSVALAGHVEIQDYAILGGLVGVHQFVKIGKFTMLGAHSMVVKDVPPYTLFSGDPCHFEGLNYIGLRRRGFSDESIETLKKAFKIIYSSGLNVSQAISKLKEEISQNDEVDYLINFIETSKRGITK